MLILSAAGYVRSRQFASDPYVQTQTVTRAAESDCELVEIYNVLAEVSNLPRWAPIFAEAIECVDDTHYRVMKNGERFNLEVFLHRSDSTVDDIREMPSKKRGGANIRVTPDRAYWAQYE